MPHLKFLLDTNIIIPLEDSSIVPEHYSTFQRIASEKKAGLFLHEAAHDDIKRDKDQERKNITESKFKKFTLINKPVGVNEKSLSEKFGPIKNENDLTDAYLLHALFSNAINFLVTEDKRLHSRAKEYCPNISERVLYLESAIAMLAEPHTPTALNFIIKEVKAHQIDQDNKILNLPQKNYAGFKKWWEKCQNQHRDCWIIEKSGEEIIALVVRKDESHEDTDAQRSNENEKILKICTFTVDPNYRGNKVGELLLKQILWYAQENRYDHLYLTAYDSENVLINLIEYYGFEETKKKPDGEVVYEKKILREALKPPENGITLDFIRNEYPRFYLGNEVKIYVIPIRKVYHEKLFPELNPQSDLFSDYMVPEKPGNTIRKVYICRSPQKKWPPGTMLLFYKSKSKDEMSQSITTLGICQGCELASTKEELISETSGRSVYLEQGLEDFFSSQQNPVKVINFLLIGHLNTPIHLNELRKDKVLDGAPQSVCSVDSTEDIRRYLKETNFGFQF